MINQEPSETSRIADALDSKQIFKLFFYSFEHSQGSPTAQNLILLYITRKAPNFQITREQLEEFNSIIPFDRFVKNENTHKTLVHGNIDQRIAGQHRAEIYTFFLITNSDPPKDIEYPAVSINYANAMRNTPQSELIPKLLDSLLERDTKYLYEGRAKKESDGKSYLREYALLGKSTGYSIYDQMYSDLQVELEKAISSKESQVWEKIQKLGVIWEAKHPGENFLTNNLTVNDTE